MGLGQGQSSEEANLFLRPLADVPYLKIVDYTRPVMGASSRDEEEKLGDCEGGTLVFRPNKGQKRHKLENVTKEQWVAASLRIMDALTRSGKLPQHLTSDYLGYIIFITDLAQQYQWQDVLQYDDLYRREQAKLECRWGTPIATLGRLWLQPRNMNNNGIGPRQAPNNNQNKKPNNFGSIAKSVPQKGPIDPQTGREMCMAYNRGSCRFANDCRHLHICSVPSCRKPHPRVQHPSPPTHSA